MPATDRVIREASPELPSIVIQDNRLYVGGIHVFREQLSPEELREYFPEEYLQKYRKGEILCPVPGCSDEIKGHDKRSLVMHARQKHADWYEENRKLIYEAGSVEELTTGLGS